MSRGKRYSNDDRKLNLKKVFAVVIAIVVMIMFVIAMKQILKEKPKTNEKSFALAYYAVYENGKWGVIDTKGNTIIKPEYSEMIVIPDNTKPVFIYMKDVDYEKGTYSSKAINEKGKEIFTSYDKVEAIYNHDESNNMWYEANILKVQKDGKYGLINLDGKEILSCTQDNIEEMPGVKSVYITTVDGKKGIVDNMGKVIIENKYTEITALTSKYSNGFIVKNEQGKYVIGISPVYEKSIIGYVHYYGSYMYFDKDGTVVESSCQLIDGIPEIKGLTYNHIVLNEKLDVNVPEVFGAIMDLKQYLDKYNIDIDEIDVDDELQLSVKIGKIKVLLGNDSVMLSEKIYELSCMIPKFGDKSGTLDMREYSRDSKYVILMEDKE